MGLCSRGRLARIFLAWALLALAALYQARAEDSSAPVAQPSSAPAAQPGAQTAALAPAAAQAQADDTEAAPATAIGGVIPLTVRVKPENPLSRFEIVSLGTFPIMLFYSDFLFDMGRYVSYGFNASYAPWPFKSSYSASITDSERATRIVAALGGCIFVGTIDAIIHAKKVKAAQRLREAASSLGERP